MVNIIKQEIEMETDLKNKLMFICSFCNTTLIIYINNVKMIEHTNISLKPHRIVIKETTYINQMFMLKKYKYRY